MKGKHLGIQEVTLERFLVMGDMEPEPAVLGNQTGFIQQLMGTDGEAIRWSLGILQKRVGKNYRSQMGQDPTIKPT